MNRPNLYVDFNEMLEPDLVLLAASDSKIDVNGENISLHEGLEINIYMDDTDSSGKTDNLIASGLVERNATSGWAAHVKWCCRIDSKGIRHESEIEN